MNDDIIVAVATSRLEAAISIIRLSGKDVIAFVQQFFTGKIINKESHTITYGYIKDNGEKIDEVLVNYIMNYDKSNIRIIANNIDVY